MRRIVPLWFLEGSFVTLDVCEWETVRVCLEVCISIAGVAKWFGRDSVEKTAGWVARRAVGVDGNVELRVASVGSDASEGFIVGC
jgi:hypothetical protein